MPRFAITTARKHGETVPRVIAGPELSLDSHKAAFRDLAASREHPEFAEIAIWESDAGITRTLRFREPAVDPKAKAKAKTDPEAKPKEEEAKAEAEEKATADQTSDPVPENTPEVAEESSAPAEESSAPAPKPAKGKSAK